MTKWIIIVAMVFAGFILGYSVQHLGDELPISPPSTAVPVLIRHSLKDGVHYYTGALTLPHSCHTITTDLTRAIKDPTMLVLALTTNDRMFDERLCLRFPVEYPFEILADVPKVTSIKLRVNGVDTPINTIEVEWRNRRNTIIN